MDCLAATRASDRTHEIYLIYLETFFGSSAATVESTTSMPMSLLLHSLSIRVQNSGKPLSRKGERMIFVNDTIPTPKFLRRFSIRNSPSFAEGVYPRNYMVDRQTIHVSDLHFYTFPKSSTFSCWKVRFKIEVCACS